MIRPAAFCIAAATAVLITTTILVAGPLDPPAGPVASTYKTLAQVEPRIALDQTSAPGNANCQFVISKPGSYYLTGNITGAAGKIGILLLTSNVTIDLMGYKLEGLPGSAEGITTGVAIQNVTIRNGSITGWGTWGCFIECKISTIENITASFNANDGIRPGDNATIRNCSATSNGGTGIFAGNYATITDCSATQSGSQGIFAGDRFMIERCHAVANSGNGIQAGSLGSITRCTSTNNVNSGIAVAATNTVSDNVSAFNGNLGGILVTGNSNHIFRNTCNGNLTGYRIQGALNIIDSNYSNDNTLDFSIAVNNNVAPVVTAPASAAVNGNTGGAGLNSTDPRANICAN